MTSPIRVLAALFALVALSLAGAGALWASSTCASGADPDDPTASMTGACAAAVGSEDANRSGERESAPQEGAHCPMAPSAASGVCSAAVLLASEVPNLSALSPEGVIVPPSPAQTRDLLLVSGFFRPPRA